MSVLDTLAAFRADPDFMRDVMAWERAPAAPPRHAPFPARLNPALVEALKRRGIPAPYTHQAQAIESVLAGRHTVIVASAAGGKSLCFQAPIAQALMTDPDARALCLYPTKALAQDQLAALSRLLAPILAAEGSGRGTARPAPAAAYDGDTPAGRRADIRRDARVIVSNADMLHLGILPHHTRWAAFFKRLKYVVIDEMHVYRGIFGSHVANVIRRLNRLCDFYGSKPVYILASATTANPREHAERLIEAPVALVNDDGSPHGERHVLIVNPPLVDAELGLRRSSLLVAPEIAARFIDCGAQTICFARTRQDTEVFLTYLRARAGQAIAGYRGGYLPEERREIEAGLRNGAVRGVVATNALELGIDIGELDACVLLGYPGSIASFWQQAGRSGRRRNASVAVMVASATALDQYLTTHPEYLFQQTPEHARLAPDNLGVLAAHLACAAFELPFNRGDRFGASNIDGLLDALAEEGDIHASDASALPLFRRREEGDRREEGGGGRGEAGERRREAGATRYTWVGESYPADRVNLRGIGERVLVMEPGCDQDRLIGETERGLAPARVHPGAIYLHQGETYQVTALDWEQGRATAQRVDSDYYTDASVASEVVVLSELGRREVGRRGQGEEPAADGSEPPPQQPVLAWGEIQVTSRATRYRQVQFNTHRTLGWGEIDLPEQTLLTNGYWFCVPEETVERLAKEGVLKMPNDYGPHWAQQRDAARARDQYRCVVCGAPERPGRQHDVHHKKPFRQFGYMRGENDHDRQANRLDNLITVCPNCHQKVELSEATRTALQALSYLAGNLASLFVMCDPSDLATLADIKSPHTRLPTITVYEMTPGGTGLVEELFAHHAELLDMAAQRIRECPCERGCPACVGPVDEQAQERDLKKDTLRLIEALA